MITRAASEHDFEAIQRIYADAVLNSASSFEIEAPSIDELRARHARLVEGGYPYLVAEVGGEMDGEVAGEVAGYCYAGPFRDRPAYRQTVESTVYVASAFRRRGVARLLMGRLIDACASSGLCQMIAVIGGKRNAASIALHEALGFDRVGVLRDVGRKFDAWQDVCLMQRALVDKPSGRG